MGGLLARILAGIGPAARGVKAAATSSTAAKIAAGIIATDTVVLPALNQASEGAVPSPNVTRSLLEAAGEEWGKIFGGTTAAVVTGSATEAAKQTTDQVGRAISANGGPGAQSSTVLFIAVGVVLVLVLAK